MNQTLGMVIASRRKQQFMTQEELANKMYVSKSAIAKWETDGGNPDRDNLYKLAEVLQLPVDSLYQIMLGNRIDQEDISINITSEVIRLLESYGYKVIRPEENKTEQ